MYLDSARPGTRPFSRSSSRAERSLRTGALLAGTEDRRFDDEPVEVRHEDVLATLRTLTPRLLPGRRVWPVDAALNEGLTYQAAVLALADEVRGARGPVAAAQALALVHHRLMRPGLGELRHIVAKQLLAESGRTLRQRDTLVGLIWRTVDFVLDGDVRAGRCLTELREVLAIEHDRVVAFMLRAIDVMFEIRAGRFEDAERAAKECADVGAETGGADADAWYASHMIAIRWFQGRIAELLPIVRATAARADLSPADYSYRSAVAVAAAAAGRRKEAGAALAVLGGGGLSRVPDSGSWLVTMYGVVEAAYLLGEKGLAGEAYDLLGPYAGLPITAGPAVSCFGSVEHALGVAQLTLGHPEVAVEHLCAAVAHNTALGHWPAVTLARHRLGVALAGSGRVEHRDQAGQQAQTARRDADQLGMRLPATPAPTAAALTIPAATASAPTAAPTAAPTVDLAVADPATADLAVADPATADPATVDPPGPPLGADPQPVIACRRTGRHWQVEAAGRRVLVTPCRGMAYLAVLLANPAHEISALELATGPHTTPDTTTNHTIGPSDDVPIPQLRSRLGDVLKELERCDAAGDRDAAVRASTERDLLLARLRLATGLIDRSGATAMSEEQARVAVGKAIRRALARVAKVDPKLGAMLTATIHTGRRCVYLPLDRLDDGEA